MDSSTKFVDYVVFFCPQLFFFLKNRTRIGDEFQAINLPEPIEKPVVEQTPTHENNV